MNIQVITNVVFVVFSLFFTMITLNLPNDQAQSMGPKAWPLIVLIGLLILSIIQIIKSYKNNNVNVKDIKFDYKKATILLCLLLFYFIIIRYLGFIISTIILMYSLSLIIYKQRPQISLIFSVVITLIVSIFFIFIIQLPLPRGVGAFRTISYLLY